MHGPRAGQRSRGDVFMAEEALLLETGDCENGCPFLAKNSRFT
jgi:hypothetical protein